MQVGYKKTFILFQYPKYLFISIVLSLRILFKHKKILLFVEALESVKCDIIKILSIIIHPFLGVFFPTSPLIPPFRRIFMTSHMTLSRACASYHTSYHKNLPRSRWVRLGHFDANSKQFNNIFFRIQQQFGLQMSLTFFMLDS